MMTDNKQGYHRIPGSDQPYTIKFKNFIVAIAGAKKNGASIVVTDLWVIGDTEAEREESRRRLKEAGVELFIVNQITGKP